MAHDDGCGGQDRRPHASDGREASSSRVYFHQGCPVCGRRLEIDVSLLGRTVYCQHCGGGFAAMDPSLAASPAQRPSTHARVDALLEQAALVIEQAYAEGDAD
ncbi:MAG: hypothetical protein ACKO4T_14405 [Planctomycetaceae bacterium]